MASGAPGVAPRLLWRSRLNRLRVLSAWNRGELRRRGAHEAACQEKETNSDSLKRSNPCESEEPELCVPEAKRQRTTDGHALIEQGTVEEQKHSLGVAESFVEGRDANADCSTLSTQLALALRAAAAEANKSSWSSATASSNSPPVPPAPPHSPSNMETTRDAVQKPPRSKLDASTEITRILGAESPEAVLRLSPEEGRCEEVYTAAWKRLVLLLHPDKLQNLDAEVRAAGVDALNFVHEAKDELRRRAQEVSAEVPAEPKAAGPPKCSCGEPGKRKYEFSWRVPEHSDAQRPVEKYEVWGPRVFSDAGEPFDWVLLATLPPLQTHFVLVEEAPTQQDVMWAGDRSLRPTLPITVHAVNGKGSSEALGFELPWASYFTWLRGHTSVLCPCCLQVSAQRGRWTKCSTCGFGMGDESQLSLRCGECQGQVLWARDNTLSCSSCFRKFAEQRRNAFARDGQAPLKGGPIPWQPTRASTGAGTWSRSRGGGRW